jgi:hypothetical protein
MDSDNAKWGLLFGNRFMKQHPQQHFASKKNQTKMFNGISSHQ